MAQKRTGKTGKVRKPSAPLPTRIHEAALKIAADEGWGSVTPRMVAHEIGEDLSAILKVAPTRAALACVIFRHIDDAVLDEAHNIDGSETPRDRLFEVLMIRFDVLQGHRAGILSLLAYYRQMPLAALCRLPGVAKSMTLMLSVADANAPDPFEGARGPALALGYIAVLQAWMKDESADMATTMSALDKMLSRMEKLQATAERFVSRDRHGED